MIARMIFHDTHHRTSKKVIQIESLFILQYIYRRLETMKNPHNNIYNRRICLYRIENKVPKGLLADCGINLLAYKNWNDKHRKIRRLIETFLDYLKTADIKEIKDYHYYKTINAEGYQIYFTLRSTFSGNGFLQNIVSRIKEPRECFGRDRNIAIF